MAFASLPNANPPNTVVLALNPIEVDDKAEAVAPLPIAVLLSPFVLAFVPIADE
ncbi:hypothetical protein D3C76_1210520 [compost metagenome]